jgi:hypothetical protein
MKTKTTVFKAFAIGMVVILTLQPLSQINAHTYALSVSNFNYALGCTGYFVVPYDFIRF